MSAPAESPPGLMPHEEKLPPRWDLAIAAVFLVIGAAILVVALGMPTYREQQGEIYKAPGVVPGLYGLVLMLLSLWLAGRAIGAGALRGPSTRAAAPRAGFSNARLALAALLCVVFAAGLIGRLPFWLAAALFVFSFTTLFEWRAGMARPERLRRLAIALALALGTGIGVVLVFEKLFLVRLP